MGNSLEDAGWTWQEDPTGADLILVNTCGFIEAAQEESINTALALLADHQDTPVALTGCLAQRFAGDLANGMPELAGVFGNRQPDQVVEFVRRVMESRDTRGAPVVWVPDGRREPADTPRRRLITPAATTYLKIAEGCDHHCSFCAIPSIRGTLRARSQESVLREFRELRKRGIFEFNLVAQDLAAWRDTREDRSFLTLVDALLAEPGDFWLRPLYLYPDQFPRELVHRTREDQRILPYFDLSFQHGSREILRRMGRPGSPEGYLDLVRFIRSANGDAALRSSFIVGFPGETESHVAELIGFLEAAELEWVGVFEYSPQEGTPAARIRTGVVPRKERARRRIAVEAAQQAIAVRRLERFTGRTLQVLVEEVMQGTSMALGRSPLQAPEVDGLVVIHNAGGVVPGEVVTARVTGVTGVDLQAVVQPRVS